MTSKTAREAVKETVRQAADIVEVIGEYVMLKKAGSRLVGLCPFHGEKTPSFSVTPDRQFFYCFGCGASGDVFSFVMKYHHMEFPEALKTLADKYHIQLPQRDMTPAEQRRMQETEQLYAVNQAAAEFFSRRLFTDPQAKSARAYLLHQRKISEECIRNYQLGYAPAPEQAGWSILTDYLRSRFQTAEVIEKAGLAVKRERGGYYDRFRERVMFPILDLTGRVVAFGGRILGEGKPKYMNSPESPVFDKSRLLFGLFQHKHSIRKKRTALVVEGNFDLLSLAVHGIDNAVAPLGTSLTRQHVKLLRRYCREVVLLFDADTAGLKAAMRSIPFFLAERLDCRVALLPRGHDPDSLVREQGGAAIIRQTENARPLPEFVFESLVQEYGLTLHGKNRILAELRPLVDEAGDQTQKTLMTAHFCEKLGISPDQFGQVTRRQPASGQLQPRSSVPQMAKRERQLLDFVIMYPESIDEFLAAGMKRVIHSSFGENIIVLLQQLQHEGNYTPEQLLSLLDKEEDRQYVARLLMSLHNEAEEGDDDDDLMQKQKEEILQWLHGAGERQQGALLQQRIHDAEKQGDTDLLMKLLQQKLDAEKKRTGY
ncbi:MAG: DNA primase [Desulfobulbus propionicus]|nr:MAG: DNA primase [Desulfobulbus propionicus]